MCGFQMTKDIRGSLNHTRSKALEIHLFPIEALVNKNPHKIHQYNFKFKVSPEYSTEFHSHLYQPYGSKSGYLCPFIISVTIIKYNFLAVTIFIVLKRLRSPQETWFIHFVVVSKFKENTLSFQTSKTPLDSFGF